MHDDQARRHFCYGHVRRRFKIIPSFSQAINTAVSQNELEELKATTALAASTAQAAAEMASMATAHVEEVLASGDADLYDAAEKLRQSAVNDYSQKKLAADQWAEETSALETAQASSPLQKKISCTCSWAPCDICTITVVSCTLII